VILTRFTARKPHELRAILFGELGELRLRNAALADFDIAFRHRRNDYDARAWVFFFD